MERFSHADFGMTRFPPNVEQITVRREGGVAVLGARRNELKLEFPLQRSDCEHLAQLLLKEATCDD
jgi:hypothetical protein